MLRVVPIALLVACAVDDPAPIGEPWVAKTMPARRLEAASGALGTRLVIAGGFAASETEGLPITTDILTFDPLLEQVGKDPWGTLPPAPVAWTHANLAAVGGSVYLLGGLDGRSFVAEPEAFVLEPVSTSSDELVWKPLPPLPEPRGAAAIVVSQGHIYLLGGATTDGVTASVLDFELESSTWIDPSPIPPLPTARSHAAAMRTYDGTFIIAGGLGDLTTSRPLGDVYALRFPPVDGEAPMWTLREPMPTARGGCAYGVAFGHLICAGGEAGLEALDVVEIYDPIPNDVAPGGRWFTHDPIPEPRAGARGAVVANQLYIPGGSATLAFEPTDSLFVFSPLAPSSAPWYAKLLSSLAH